MNFTTGLRSTAVAATAIAMLAMGTADRAEAIGIDGSLPLVIFGAGQNGANLGVSTLLTGNPVLTSGAGIGDYLPIPSSTTYGTFTLDLSDLGAFAISNATYGSFDAQAAGSFIVSQNAQFLDVFLLGTYTPGPGLAAETSLRISFNQSGDTISGAITLNTPPVRVPPPSVPAPASLALFGAALAGLAVARRRLS
jgi:hypothetical protein